MSRIYVIAIALALTFSGAGWLSFVHCAEALAPLDEAAGVAKTAYPVVNIWSTAEEPLPDAADQLYLADELSAMMAAASAPEITISDGFLISATDAAFSPSSPAPAASALAAVGKKPAAKASKSANDDWRTQLLREAEDAKSAPAADDESVDAEPQFSDEAADDDDGAELDDDEIIGEEDDEISAETDETGDSVSASSIATAPQFSTGAATDLIAKEQLRRQAGAIEAAHYLAQGRNFFDAGQYEAALIEFDRALAADPALAEARSYRSRARQLAGRPDGNDDEAVVKDIVRLTEARLKERELRLNSGLERASEFYLRTVTPSGDRSALKRGEQLELNLLDLEAAEQSLQAVQLLLRGSGLPPQMEQTLELRARALAVQITQERQKLVAEREMRDRDSAMQQVRDDRANVNAQQAQEVGALLTAAEYHLTRKEFDSAMELIEKALSLDPKSEKAYQLRGQTRILNRQETATEITQDLKDSIENWSLDVQEAYILDAKKYVTYPLDWERIRARAKRVRVGSAVNEEERKILARMAGIIGDFDYFEQPLALAVRDFEQRAQVTISLAGGISGEETTVTTARLSGVTMKAALDQILEDLEMEYRYEDEALVISKKGAVKGAPVMRVYPVADIVMRTTEFQLKKSMTSGMSDDTNSDDSNTLTDDDDDDSTEWRLQPFDIIATLTTSIGGADTWEAPNGIMKWEENLVVFNTPEIQNAVAEFLDEWRSSARQQVFVEGRFLDISDSFGEMFGFQWGAASNGNVGGGSYNSGLSFAGASADSKLWSVGSGNHQGGFLGNLTLNSLRINLTLAAAQRTQKGTLLHNPKLLVTNGQNAYCSILNERSYVRDFDFSSGGDTSSFDPTIGKLMTGINWEVRPVISFDRKYITVRVRPEIVQELPNYTLRDGYTVPNTRGPYSIDVGQGKAEITIETPIRRATRFWSNAIVPDGGTVLVGGQLVDRTADTVTGVPVLSNLPIIGRLARTDKKNRETTNRVIMLSAKIVDLED